MIKNSTFLSIFMGRISQYFQWVMVILFLGTGVGCSPSAKPPKFMRAAQSNASTQHFCSDLKLVGPLSSAQFKNLFQCLNRNNALNGLEPLLFDDLQNESLFLSMHNHFLSADAGQRRQTLKFLRALHQNGGLDQLFSLSSKIIDAFIMTDDFENHIQPLLSEIYNDDHDLLKFFRALVSYPRFSELVRVLNNAFERGSSRHYLVSLGYFLRHEGPSGRRGTQNLITALNALFKRAGREDAPSFGLKDIHQLSLDHVPENLLHALEDLKENHKLGVFNQFLSDLAHHQTATFLTEER